MNFSIEDSEVNKEINEIDKEVLHILSPFKYDSEQYYTIERKRKARCNRSVIYINLLDTRDPSNLTSNEKKLKRTHNRKI